MHQRASAHGLFALIFLSLWLGMRRLGLAPTHDVIGCYAAWHYWIVNLGRGVVPYWNPYSEAGTPFYPYVQLLGLLAPWNYAFALLERLRGGSTLTLYVLQCFVPYLLFIAGAYETFRILTKAHGVSLLFSLVLLAATFPTFMRQNTPLLQFSLAPLVMAFALRFLEARDPRRRGASLFAAACLLALACLGHLPSGMIFFALALALAAAATGWSRARDVADWARAPAARGWILASLGVGALIVSPLIALLWDTGASNELFPYIRLQLRCLHHLPRLFASDAGLALFHERAAAGVSLSLGNLAGLLTGPWELGDSSEVQLYLGVLPLVCLLALARGLKASAQRRNAALVALMLAATFFLMTNLSWSWRDPPSAFQRGLQAVVPTLDRLEVFESFGALFLFLLAALAALGFQRAGEEGGEAVWLAGAALTVAKWGWAYRWLSGHPEGALLRAWLWRHERLLRAAGAVPAGLLAWSAMARLWPRSRAGKLRAAAVGLLSADLLLFLAVDVWQGRVVQTAFPRMLAQQGLPRAALDVPFEDRRVPLMTDPYGVYNFFGPEILAGRKAALPRLFNQALGNSASVIDNVFSTRAYYDYLVNVSLDRQMVASAVASPILSFFPAERAVQAADPREAARRLNAMGLRALSRSVVIERRPAVPLPTAAVDLALALAPANFLPMGRAAGRALASGACAKFPSNAEARIDVGPHDPNRLSVLVDARRPGYLYFADGYSKHWTAAVDGEPAVIERADVAFKAVAVGQGLHRVDFAYDPVWIRRAIWANAVGILLALAIGAAAMAMSASQAARAQSRLAAQYGAR